MDINKTVKEVIAKVAATPITEVGLSDALEKDLNIDGEEKAIILLELQKELKIDLSHIETPSFETVAELVDIVKDELGEV